MAEVLAGTGRVRTLLDHYPTMAVAADEEAARRKDLDRRLLAVEHP